MDQRSKPTEPNPTLWQCLNCGRPTPNQDGDCDSCKALYQEVAQRDAGELAKSLPNSLLAAGPDSAAFDRLATPDELILVGLPVLGVAGF
jgi:predicted ATP-dependent serine protease